jgi:hypothetical protein
MQRTRVDFWSAVAGSADGFCQYHLRKQVGAQVNSKMAWLIHPLTRVVLTQLSAPPNSRFALKNKISN